MLNLIFFNIKFLAIIGFGISREDWDKNLDYIANNTLADPYTGFSPRVPSLDEVKAIYNACYEGVVFQEAVIA